MAIKLNEDSIRSAIQHLCRFGDTDIFPHLFELLFLSENIEEVAKLLSETDLQNFNPSHSVEALAPKSRYGFRIANQLMFVDALVFLAGVIELGPDLETLKAPHEELGPFAYRFEDQSNGSLFAPNRSYRNWIGFQREFSEQSDFSHVVYTDIADFYQRIYFHRIENVLRSASSKQGIASLIERIIKKIRAKQSYGIPVGGTASRFIAEAVLSDFDHSLEAEEYQFSRFVDDIRIFVGDGESPYRALATAAEALLAEGLTLNAQKTKVLTKEQYVEHLDDEGLDTFDETQREALEMLSASIYFDDAEGPTDEQLASLQTINLVMLLEELLEHEIWDFGKVRSVLRALRLTRNSECIPFLIENLEKLLPFVKDIVLLLDTLQENGELPIDFDITEQILSYLSEGAGRRVAVIRAWLMELFIRQITPLTAKQLNAIERTSELDGRQIVLCHAAIGDVVYFRKNKTRLDQFSRFEQYALVVGATCLPKDEFETWVDATRAGMSSPLEKSFCSWAKSKHGAFPQLVSDLANLAQSSDD